MFVTDSGARVDFRTDGTLLAGQKCLLKPLIKQKREVRYSLIYFSGKGSIPHASTLYKTVEQAECFLSNSGVIGIAKVIMPKGWKE